MQIAKVTDDKGEVSYFAQPDEDDGPWLPVCHEPREHQAQEARNLIAGQPGEDSTNGQHRTVPMTWTKGGIEHLVHCREDGWSVEYYPAT